MRDKYKLYWGETHHNTYMGSRQDPALGEVLEFASKHLDFYTGAYYTPIFTHVPVKNEIIGSVDAGKDGHPSEALPPGIQWKGVGLEEIKSPEVLEREWDEFQQVTHAWNHPGEFVAFPGYEWQGDGRWGDHNVTYESEGIPICNARTLAELYDFLRDKDAIAIPHHTGYCPGRRAPIWSNCDETISPYAEVYSLHGCSETDEEWIGLRRNPHMGPGVAGGTYQDALDMGLHLGAICSTDNWKNTPGQWNQGLMGCYATDLTRENLWEAFLARRVYGVTGDRIELDFTCNGAPMGSILDHSPKQRLCVNVRGWDAIDRIEVLRNGRVIATRCHQGTWDIPRSGRITRFKFRVEVGWGARLGEIPMGPKRWEGELSVAGGKMLSWSPCWVKRDQGVPQLEGDTARFTMTSYQDAVTLPSQGATVFEFECDPSAEMTLKLNGMVERDTVRNFAMRSRLLWYRDECVELVRQTTGVEPETAKRGDIYYHLACKAKLHRAIPEAGYTAGLEIIDDEPLTKETNYRVRVEQRNAQRAWSSPIWVRPES